jgi:hypothetical protein
MKEIISEKLAHDLDHLSVECDYPNLHGILALACEQSWPYLRAAGLPEYLVSNPKVLSYAYEHLRHKYCIAFATLYDSTELIESRVGGGFHSIGDHRWIRFKLWCHFLEQLAKLSSRDVAVEFDRWARRHWFSGETNIAMYEWKSVLESLTASEENEWMIKVPLPDFIRPMLPELRKLVSCEISHSVLGELNGELVEEKGVEKEGVIFFERDGLAKSLYEQWSNDNSLVIVITKRTSDGDYVPPQYCTSAIFPEFEYISAAVVRDGMFQALRLLANHLSSSQQREFVSWAEAQSNSGIVASSKHLCGDTFLRTNFLFHDSPSILTTTLQKLPSFWNKLDWF